MLPAASTATCGPTDAPELLDRRVGAENDSCARAGADMDNTARGTVARPWVQRLGCTTTSLLMALNGQKQVSQRTVQTRKARKCLLPAVGGLPALVLGTAMLPSGTGGDSFEFSLLSISTRGRKKRETRYRKVQYVFKELTSRALNNPVSH